MQADPTRSVLGPDGRMAALRSGPHVQSGCQSAATPAARVLRGVTRRHPTVSLATDPCARAHRKRHRQQIHFQPAHGPANAGIVGHGSLVRRAEPVAHRPAAQRRKRPEMRPNALDPAGVLMSQPADWRRQAATGSHCRASRGGLAPLSAGRLVSTRSRALNAGKAR